jgi:hypothetical protein
MRSSRTRAGAVVQLVIRKGSVMKLKLWWGDRTTRDVRARARPAHRLRNETSRIGSPHAVHLPGRGLDDGVVSESRFAPPKRAVSRTAVSRIGRAILQTLPSRRRNSQWVQGASPVDSFLTTDRAGNRCFPCDIRRPIRVTDAAAGQSQERTKSPTRARGHLLGEVEKLRLSSDEVARRLRGRVHAKDVVGHAAFEIRIPSGSRLERHMGRRAWVAHHSIAAFQRSVMRYC